MSENEQGRDLTEADASLVPEFIETVTYDLIYPDGTRFTGKVVADKVVDGTFYCSPSIEPGGTETQHEAAKNPAPEREPGGVSTQPTRLNATRRNT